MPWQSWRQVVELPHCGSALATSTDCTSVSRLVGVYKPKQKIFKAAMAEFDPKYKAQDYLMVGDHWQGDIGGAKQMGMDQAFLNLKDKEVKDGTCTYHFTELLALKDMFMER